MRRCSIIVLYPQLTIVSGDNFFIYMVKVQLTKEGYEKLQTECKEFKELRRPQAVERLQKARAMGDLSENSEYSSAKEELAFIEGRVQEIEAILKNCEIIETQHNGVAVSLGDRVIVQTNGTREEFFIVGEFEADPVEKKLSNTSPLGQALLGKKVGENIEIDVPAGRINYKIVDIR